MGSIGYVQIGTSQDISEFACDSIYYWWTEHGRKAYAEATSILLLCDGGGSNGSRFFIFKQDLQQLADDLGIEIRIAHYPPYTAKYNPIKHRLFPQLSRACRGVIFDLIECVQDLMARASTLAGLKVFASIIDAVYETGRTATDDFKQKMLIIFDDFLPNWNYVARPQQL